MLYNALKIFGQSYKASSNVCLSHLYFQLQIESEGEETELKINHVVSSKNIPVRINWQKSTDIYLAL